MVLHISVPVLSCPWPCTVILTADLSGCGTFRDSQQFTLYINWLCKHDAHHDDGDSLRIIRHLPITLSPEKASYSAITGIASNDM
jgi:hypothetical protein